MNAFPVLVVSFAVLAAAATPAFSQIKPQSSGDTSFNEPALRKHHHGLIFPNQPGRPRVGYHRHHRHHPRGGAPMLPSR